MTSAQLADLLMGMQHKIQQWHESMSVDVEVAIPLPTALPGNEQIRIRTLPSGLMACTIYTGDDLSLGRAHAALYLWMKDSGYQVIGPPRQVHLRRGAHLDPNQYVTEVQFPVDLSVH